MFPNARHHPNLYFICHYMVIGTIMGYFGSIIPHSGVIMINSGVIMINSGANNKQRKLDKTKNPKL